MFNNLMINLIQIVNISFNIGYIWLTVSLIFLFVELATPGLFFSIAFAIGSVAAAIIAFTGYSFVIQCLALLVGFIISFLILKKFIGKIEPKRVSMNMNALVGKKGIVCKSIFEPVGGLVKVGGEVWSAQSIDGMEIVKGQIIEVVSIRGNRLIVKI